jgi:hypothetical protein
MNPADIQKWFSDEQAIAELRGALNNGYVRRAIDLVTQIGLPAQQETPTGVGLLEFGALSNAAREGYFQALRNLNALATAPSAGERSAPQRPWEYLLAEDKPAPVKRRRAKTS